MTTEAPRVERVTWKDEDEVNGEPIGPCYVYREGQDRGELVNDTWITLREARKIASKAGVGLETW